MATLKFGPTVSAKGFTSLETSLFNNLPPARIVRELIQNSLDAAVEAREATAVIRFRLDTVQLSDIPDVNGYQEAFVKAVQYWEDRSSAGHLADPAQQVVDRIKSAVESLSQGKATVLSVLDNGIGLDDKMMDSLMSDGASEKQYDLSGSYGVGHLAPMALSDIRYMLYGGLTKNGQRIACGRTILASHLGEDRLMSAEGYLIRGFRDGRDGNLYRYFSPRSHPKIIANRIDEVKMEWGHGCVVMIPAFNNFRSKTTVWEIVSKVAAYNFCSAIHRAKLIIEVCEGDDKKILDQNSLLSVLETEQIRTRAARSGSILEGLRPSGQNAYSILKTIADDGGEIVDTNIGTARISLLLQAPAGQPRVDLFRNGMWITDEIPRMKRAEFADRQPFHAVIEIEGRDNSYMHRLVRKAEGPMHDQLSFALLSEEERHDLSTAFTSIADWLKEKVPTVGTDEYTVDDFLLVNTDPNGNTGRESFSFWGIPTPVQRSNSNQLELGLEIVEVDPPEPEEPTPSPPLPPRPPTPPRPRQTKRANPLPFRSVVVPDGAGKINALISVARDLPEAWLTLRVDENTDFTCDRVWRDEDVTIASFAIRRTDGESLVPTSEIMPGGQAVKVREIEAKVNYGVRLEYNAPQELTDMVGTPVFRMELFRPQNPQKNGRSTSGEKAQNANRD